MIRLRAAHGGLEGRLASSILFVKYKFVVSVYPALSHGRRVSSISCRAMQRLYPLGIGANNSHKIANPQAGRRPLSAPAAFDPHNDCKF